MYHRPVLPIPADRKAGDTTAIPFATALPTGTNLNQKSLMFEVPALLLQIGGIFYIGVPDLFTQLFALSAMFLGTVLLIVAMTLYARAKGRSRWFGLAGLLSIVGVIGMMMLSDRRTV